MLRVAVVGAGIVGTAVAFRLARGGAAVWLLDRGRVGGGTTSTSFAWVNANEKTPRDYFELNYAGLREHEALRGELGGAPWLHPGGNLAWARDERQQAELERRVARLREWGYRAEWRTATEVARDLEPRLALGEPARPVAYFPEETWVDAPRLAERLAELAAEAGATVRTGAEVTGIDLAGGRVATVRTAGGGRLAVDAVVNAAGPGADRVAALVGRSLPLAPTAGLLVRVGVAGSPLGRVVHAPEVNLRPDGPDHLLLHHDTIDPLLGERRTVPTTDRLCVDLLERARRVLPVALESASVVAASVGIRPIPADGRSCVGAVATVPGYYEAVTHSGVTLGPLIGRLLARAILAGEVDPLIAPFRPDRFSRP